MNKIWNEKFIGKFKENPITKCWKWNMSLDSGGYGQTSCNGKTARAHRLSYKLSFGEIPKGMHVIHQCDNPPCINPSHLRIGTHQENVQDSANKKRHRCARQKQCVYGHEFTDQNTYISSYRGKIMRNCRKCRQRRKKEYRKRTGRR